MTTPLHADLSDAPKKFRKKPVVIEAVQWWKLGDHPAVTTACPDDPEQTDKGWIDTLEGGHYVTPGDWIITGVKGEHYPCKPDIFAMTYEPADGAALLEAAGREDDYAGAAVELRKIATLIRNHSERDRLTRGSHHPEWHTGMRTAANHADARAEKLEVRAKRAAAPSEASA